MKSHDSKGLFKVLVYGLFALFLCLGCWLTIIFPPPPPNQSLKILGKEKSSKNGKAALFICISNASPYSATYEGEAIWVAYLKAGTWITNSAGQGPDVSVLQRPKETFQFENYNEIPIETTTYKVGVSFTSMTWRSKLIWWKKGPNEFLDQIADYLWGLDRSSRSMTECSGVFILSTNL